MASVCEYCGAPLREGAVFCDHCGASAPQAAREQPAREQWSADGGRCPGCGAALSRNALFCTSCGRPTAEKRRRQDSVPVQARYPAQGASNQGYQQRHSYNGHGRQASRNQPGVRPAKPAGAGTGARVLTAVLAVLLLAQAGVAGWLRPGWFRAVPAGGGPWQPSATAPAQDGSGGADFSYLEDAGNSKAFTINPVEGMTISAEANALDRDRNFTVTKLPADRLDELQAIAREKSMEPVAVIGAWDLDAGLGPDDLLPGVFTTELDLKALGVMEEVYDNLAMYRVDDNGVWERYAVTRDGDALRWNSRQNCVLVLLTLGVGVEYFVNKLALSGGKPLWGYSSLKVYEKGLALRGESTKELGSELYNLNFFLPDIMVQERYLLTEIFDRYYAQMEEQAKADVEELAQIMKWPVTDEAVRSRQSYLAYEKCCADTQYQNSLNAMETYLKNEGYTPETVKTFAEQLLNARAYLKDQAKVKMPSYTVDVYMVKDMTGEGMTDTYIGLGHAFCVINTKLLTSEPKNVLTTCVHELFHASQREYVIGFNACTKFDEATAEMVEEDACVYFKESAPAHSLKWHYYAIPLDEYEAAYPEGTGAPGKADGAYPLSHFIRWLRDKKKKDMSYDTLLSTYKQLHRSPSLTEMLETAFGLDSAGHKELSELYLEFAAEKKETFAGNAGEAWSNPATNTAETPHVTLTDRNFTIRTRQLRPDVPETGTRTEHAMLVVKDEGFDAALPDTRLIPAGNGGKECKYGIFYPVKEKRTAVTLIEADGGMGTPGSTSGYTVYTLLAPDAPAVALEDGKLTAVPPMIMSEAAAYGNIDSYLVTVKANGREVLTAKLPYELWEKGAEFTLQELGYANTPESELPEFSATIRECIEAQGNYPECLGPESGEGKAVTAGGRFEDQIGIGILNLNVLLEGANITTINDAQYAQASGLDPNGSVAKLVRGTLSKSNRLRFTADCQSDGWMLLNATYYDAAGTVIRDEQISMAGNSQISVLIHAEGSLVENGNRPASSDTHLEWDFAVPDQRVAKISFRLTDEPKNGNSGAIYTVMLDVAEN